MRYSDGQVADILMIRHLFFSELGHLHRAREAALQALSDCDGDLHKVKACTDRLQSVVEATYHTYLQFGAAFAFGVSCFACHADVCNCQLELLASIFCPCL